MLPNARGHEFVNLSEQVAPGQPLSLAFTYSNTCTHKTTHTYICLHTYHTLSAPGCRATGERQCCHCVALYYTWNSEPHAFLIEVICTGTACVSIYSVSETVVALIYIPLSHCNCSSEDIQTTNLGREEDSQTIFLSQKEKK